MSNPDDQRQKVYSWLHHTDPSTIHHRALKTYQPGTGSWMLQCSEWISWLDAHERCLWIHGIPGAGKTVLISYLIEQIRQRCSQSQQRRSISVFYYCYFGHNQDEAKPFLQWLINRLCREADVVPNSVYKMYKYGGEANLEELLKALEEVLHNFNIIYVIIDAIDESNSRENLLSILRNMVTDPRFKNIQLLASSREYIDIERVMKEISKPVSMANSHVEDDIRQFVRSNLQSNPNFSK